MTSMDSDSFCFEGGTDFERARANLIISRNAEVPPEVLPDRNSNVDTEAVRRADNVFTTEWIDFR